MKEIISVSLGPANSDYEFETEFLGQDFYIRRFGTDGNLEKAAYLLSRWDNEAAVMGLGGVKFPYDIGPDRLIRKHVEKLDKLTSRLRTPVVTGENLRKVGYEWSLRHIQYKFGNNYFNNAKVLFLSGMTNYSMAKVMAEYTDNLTFADPILKNGISKFLNSLKEMERYARDAHDVLRWVPSKRLSESVIPVRAWNDYVMRKAMQKADIIVVPYYNFYRRLEKAALEELGGKTIVSSTVYDDRVRFLKERGVNVIIDSTPKILEKVVGVNVLEALIAAALNKPPEEITNDDLLEIVSEQRMDPRVIYPSGSPKRVNRFAFVIHPLSQGHLKKDRTVDFLDKVSPPGFMDAVEKVIAYAPPWVYSKVTGIKSPTGVETEGWLISVGGTPRQMLSHSPEFTYKRLLQAAKMSKRMGAQIMGLGAFTKVVGDAGVTVAKLADIPITTGNSYSASGALWAAADAVRRMGLIKTEKGRRISAKTMVMGATGAIGSVCSRLLAYAFDEIYLVGRNMAKLLAMKESILEETPDVKIHLSTRADRYLADMDVIVTATSGAGKTILDIMKVKPGCVITDVARPLDLSAEDVRKRPDVLVIESGEIELPGNPEMKNIGLPPKVVYACLAETIVLALEGRFETFTIGRDIEWQKVRAIYKMGLKHGMKLAAISGVNGVYTDEDIAKVRDLAIEARKKSDAG
ncbi:MAG: dehydrogenase [Desulfobacteraceae bacterium 4572_88]|nr:MAG: dehydrogenase [Desulfobacteraceae bacterium 4572_88]